MKLAIRGGKPILSSKLSRPYNIDSKEINAVVKLMRKGPLSGFVAEWGDAFFGGPSVVELERNFTKKFKVKFAISYNSASTALQGAIASCGIGPGDEVIVPPYTMSATASAVLLSGAVPVFADISEKNLCIDPVSIEAKITRKTKAIIAVNLLGFTCDFGGLLKIARSNKLFLIEDNAQSPGAKYKNKFCGTVGDIGVFSLNVHKVIQCGEGGVLVTNNKNLAFRAQLVRNHGEAVVDGISNYKLGPVVGSNYRLGEMAAVVAIEQLKKLDFLSKWRVRLAKHLTSGLKKIEGLELFEDTVKKNISYYVYPFKYDEQKIGISRELFVEAVKAEGFPISVGYVKPIYLLPLYQQKKVFNNSNFPFDYKRDMNQINYRLGDCPVCERMYFEKLLLTSVSQFPYKIDHIDLFLAALKKVIANKSELK